MHQEGDIIKVYSRQRVNILNSFLKNILLHQQEKEEYLIEKIGKGHKEANYKRKINT